MTTDNTNTVLVIQKTIDDWMAGSPKDRERPMADLIADRLAQSTPANTQGEVAISTLAALLEDTDPGGCDSDWSYRPQAQAMLEDPRFTTLRSTAADPVPEGQEVARPLEEWHEDHGNAVWWKFPIDEPAWIGTPLDSDWPGYHTHWTPHPKVPALANRQPVQE